MRLANTHQELIIIILEELSKLLSADHASIAFLEGDFLKTDFVMHNQKIIPVNQTTKIGKHLKMILKTKKIGFFEQNLIS